jgi:hypothetical protein
MSNGKLWQSIVGAFAIALCCGLAACSSQASSADLERLELVRGLYGDDIVFDLERDLYVRATLKPNASVPPERWERIFHSFFFDDDSLERETTFVYLNVYRSGGAFLFQLSYDPRQERFIRGRTEYY